MGGRGGGEGWGEGWGGGVGGGGVGGRGGGEGWGVGFGRSKDASCCLMFESYSKPGFLKIFLDHLPLAHFSSCFLGSSLEDLHGLPGCAGMACATDRTCRCATWKVSNGPNGPSKMLWELPTNLESSSSFWTFFPQLWASRTSPVGNQRNPKARNLSSPKFGRFSAQSPNWIHEAGRHMCVSGNIPGFPYPATSTHPIPTDESADTELTQVAWAGRWAAASPWP